MAEQTEVEVNGKVGDKIELAYMLKIMIKNKDGLLVPIFNGDFTGVVKVKEDMPNEKIIVSNYFKSFIAETSRNILLEKLQNEIVIGINQTLTNEPKFKSWDMEKGDGF